MRMSFSLLWADEAALRILTLPEVIPWFSTVVRVDVTDFNSVSANSALDGITIEYSLDNQTQTLDISLGSETWKFCLEMLSQVLRLFEAKLVDGIMAIT